MRAILRFLFGLRLIFLFIALETLAIVLIVRQNAYHRASFFNSSNAFAGKLYTQVADVRYFLSLKSINDSLAAENSRLLAQLPQNREIETATWLINDSSALGSPRYTYTSAKVVNNTIGYRNNYITLNKGINAGIEPRMAVIGPNGIVGIVKDVSANFSTVISVLNKNARISAKLLKSETTGTIVWEGSNYRVAKLIEIPIHIEVAIGDTVATSQYSNIFPENIFIGSVKDIQKTEGSSTYQIDVLLGTDYQRLSFVNIVGNKMQAERDSLERQLSYD
ncbi:MAG: rod shape-determining protein MreC [Sphingobacteriaceae bacterium]|nr:rod shape-determining protein MreC [Sphingobacteriaceae bacterium]